MCFDDEIIIEKRIISRNEPAFIIAEAGVNHNGDINLAYKLIDAAIEAGVDAVKFQSYKTKDLILKNVKKAPYQNSTTDVSESQYDMLNKLELSIDDMKKLMEYCKKKGIIFLSTPFENGSMNELYEIGVPAFKISATDLTNLQFLKQVAEKGLPILLSAGMCYQEEVDKALNIISSLNSKVVLLQCTSNYPISDEEANLRVINTFIKRYNMIVGYSDHSEGVGASPYAVACGAKVIEKHFTLDKNMNGPDHKASASPTELKDLVKEIRKVERFLGSGEKKPAISENGTRKSLQKCFVASRPIDKGEIISDKNVVAKRTNGEGISAIYYEKIMGKMVLKKYDMDEVITNEYLS